MYSIKEYREYINRWTAQWNAESREELVRHLLHRDACGSARLDGIGARLDGEPRSANPYRAEVRRLRRLKRTGPGHEAELRRAESCLDLWDMGWREQDDDLKLHRFLEGLYQSESLTPKGAKALRQMLKDRRLGPYRPQPRS